ncbi:hypothetical protein O3M35_011969 [Rhynocoris fuscipes]|uniref:Endonuclease/exonuclease/phosphatase domain-containing protein n=1 Tax=Rhynocoris fuscipes TaxID=488301 RepID=A0AAW1CRU2_9HEMI
MVISVVKTILSFLRSRGRRLKDEEECVQPEVRRQEVLVDGDVQTVEHEEEKEETCTKVVSKRRNKKPITLVGTSQQASELTGVKKAWIHLGKLKEGTTAENVETFLKKYFPELDVSSYRNKFIQLESITQEENYDVLCLSEHWMNEVQLQQYIPDGYNIASFFCRKTHHHGGVVIYIKQGWQYQEVCQITKYAEEMSCELAAIKVNNTIIVTVYRTPLSDWNVFMSNIENVFECINKYKKKAVIIGDFNIQFLGCDNKCLDFKNLCSTYGYKVTINVPTRLDSCIDNILISSNFESYQVGIINNHLSDHLAQFINFECNLVNSNNECKYRLTLTPITDNRAFLFNYLLSFVDFNQILSNNDLEKDFNCFINIIQYYFEYCFSKTTVKINNRKVTNKWFTDDLKKMKNELEIVYSLMKTVNDSELKVKYRKMKRKYRTALKEAKKSDNGEYLMKAENKNKAAWSLIKK